MADKLNLDTLLSSIIHSHNYIRVDGNEASNSKYVKQYERDKGMYSSPRNIRKLFIKNTGIDIVYYRPIVGKGDNLSESISFSDENKRLLMKILMSYVAEYQGQLEDSSVGVQGTGFASFKNDLSVSNLEELYFDWTLLLGNKEIFAAFFKANNSLQGALGLTVQEYDFYTDVNSANTQHVKMLKADTLDGDAFNKVAGTRELMSSLIAYLTKEMCGFKDGGLSANYPRLKYIGFIGNSNLVLKSLGGITKKVLRQYEFSAFYNQFDVKQIRETFTSDKFRFSIFVDTGVDLYQTGFRVDTGIYQFDLDYLNDLFKNTTCAKDMTRESELTRWWTNGVDTRLGLESKLWWINKFRTGDLQGQKAALKSLESISDRIEKTEEEKKQEEEDRKPRKGLEVAWNKILKESGEEGVIFAMQYLKLQFDKQGIIDNINGFSPVGKEYYLNLFNSLK